MLARKKALVSNLKINIIMLLGTCCVATCTYKYTFKQKIIHLLGKLAIYIILYIEYCKHIT